jgi:hypothetical protein
MRFPNESSPPAISPVDPLDITPGAAVGPVRRIGVGMQGVHPGELPHPPVSKESSPAKPVYSGENRRKLCRRIHNLPVLLDTRSGEERRQAEQTGDLVTHVSENA